MTTVNNKIKISMKIKIIRNRFALLALIVLILCVLVAILEIADVTHFFHKETAPQAVSGSSFSTKGEVNKSSGVTVDRNGPSAKTNGSSAELIAPSGDFISNHRPNLSGSPAPNIISSVCNTTPGASCVITFSKDSVTKSLPPQKTDVEGSTYWNWKLQEIGITEGTWRVQATATLYGDSKNAYDALELVVTP